MIVADPNQRASYKDLLGYKFIQEQITSIKVKDLKFKQEEDLKRINKKI